MIKTVVGVIAHSVLPSAGDAQFDHVDVTVNWTYQDNTGAPGTAVATTLSGVVTLPNNVSREAANAAIAAFVRATTLAQFTTGPSAGFGASGVIGPEELVIANALDMKGY